MISRETIATAMKILPWLIGVVFLALFAISGLARFVGDTTADLDRVVSPMIAEIAREGWTSAAIGRHATPRLKKLLATGGVGDGPPQIRALGPVRSYGGIQRARFNSGAAEIHAMFAFRHGRAVVALKLLDLDGAWKIAAINVTTNDPLLTTGPAS